MKYILGGYSQIPYGASDDDCEQLLTSQLRPLFTFLYQNPSFCFLLRLGQNYYEWLENNHPEINMLIFDLVRKNQLELLSSPAYDAVLTLLPANERSNYVEKTTLYLKKKFGKKPTGFFSSYQVFNPSLVNVISLCMMDYIVISPYNQLSGKVIGNKPFYMNELGKSCVVFPIDDVFSKEVSDFSRSSETTDKLIASMIKLASQCSNTLHTIMLNFDQLVAKPATVNVFYSVYSALGEQSTLPSTYLKEKTVVNLSYLPDGIFGRDYSVGNASSFNQYIIDNHLYLRRFLTLNFLKTICKDIKKGSDLKKETDSLLLKASSGSCYIDNRYRFDDVSSFPDSFMCQTEHALVSSGSFVLPQNADINGNGTNCDILYTKDCMAYISCKGATLNRFVVFDFMRDFARTDVNGFFCDSFKAKENDKTFNLSNRLYELKNQDKHRQDVVYSLVQFEVNKHILKIDKHYRLVKNGVNLDVDIVDTKKSDSANLLYESYLCIDLGKNAVVSEPEQDGQEVTVHSDKLVISNKEKGFTFSFLLNKTADIYMKIAKNGAENYKYHLIKSVCPVSFDSDGLEHLKFNVKIDKC